MTLHEIHELRTVSPTRRNTSTLESQPDTPDAPQTPTNQSSTQLGASNLASALTLREWWNDPWLPIRLVAITYPFRRIVDERWAESLVGKALLRASDRDTYFQSAYIQIRNRTKAHLNTLFDIHLSLPPGSPNLDASVLQEYSLDDCLDRLHRVLKMEYTNSFLVW